MNDHHRCPKGHRRDHPSFVPMIWKILHEHERARDEERGPAVSVKAPKVRARKMIRELRVLGYRVELISPAPSA